MPLPEDEGPFSTSPQFQLAKEFIIALVKDYGFTKTPDELIERAFTIASRFYEFGKRNREVVLDDESWK